MSDNKVKHGFSKLLERIRSNLTTQSAKSILDVDNDNLGTGDNDTESSILEPINEDNPIEVNTSDFSEVTSKTTAQILDKTNIDSKYLNSKFKYYSPAPAKLLINTSETCDYERPEQEVRLMAEELIHALKEYGIDTNVISITNGPLWIIFEMTYPLGIRINKLLSIKEDLQLRLSAKALQIEAPIPGKSAIAISIKKTQVTSIGVRELIESKEYQDATETTIILGRDQRGVPLYCDLEEIKHIMITGHNADEISLLRDAVLCGVMCKANPIYVRMIVIDTRVLDLIIINGIPHLIMPNITSGSDVPQALKWVTEEIERRLYLLEITRKRSIKEYNDLVDDSAKRLFHCFVLINTLDGWDYQSVNNAHQLDSILSKADLVGIHLIVFAKADINNPTYKLLNERIDAKIVFSVPSEKTSVSIMKASGAEELQGGGDMLYIKNSIAKPIRGVCACASSDEITSVSDYLRTKYGSNYISLEKLGANSEGLDMYELIDNLFVQAVEAVLANGSASVSVIQRRLGVGYPRAASLIDDLEKKRIIGPYSGSVPRKVLITEDEWSEMKKQFE